MSVPRDSLRAEVARLPPRVREFLQELYSRPDWASVRVHVMDRGVVSRWSAPATRRAHMVTCERLGVLRLASGVGGVLCTVPDPEVRDAVLGATSPRREASLLGVEDRDA